MEFSFKKKNALKSEKNTRLFHTFFTKKYGALVLLVLCIGAGLALYEIYSVTYDTLIIPKTVQPGELQKRQEQINITRYEATRASLQRKQDTTVPAINIPDVFSAKSAAASGGSQAPLP